MLGSGDVQLLDYSGWLRDRISTAWANVCTENGRDLHFVAALESAAAAIRQGHTVVVHCVRGRHRTGAFLAALKARQWYFFKTISFEVFCCLWLSPPPGIAAV